MQTTKSRHSRRGSHVSRGSSHTNTRNAPQRGRGRFTRSRSTDARGGRADARRGGGQHRSQNRGGGRKLPTFDPSQFINTHPIDVVETVYEPTHTFTTFGLDNRVVRNIRETNLTIPTPIQDQIIPEILNGRDVIGLAETGTGKTAAFLLPLISKTLREYNRQTLILTPTRELALQIEAELRKLGNRMKLYATVCVGGTSMGPQIRGLRRQNHFIIGTPGRILDLIQRNELKTKGITTVVLDEADRMLDMGFINDMRKILSEVPKDRETLFFSATMGKDTDALVHEFLRDPVTVSVKKKDVIDSIEQTVIRYNHHDKFDTLRDLFNDPSFKRVIVFGAMKHSVEKLSKELTRSGVVAESIHGNKSHNARQRSLKTFKSGNSRVLVATDVAARGIHVDNVSHVINYDLPNTFEDYVHRIGRTGRGSQKGKAVTFVPNSL